MLSRPNAAAWALSMLAIAALGGSLFRIPVQVSEALEVIERVAPMPSVGAAFADGLTSSRTILRPMRQAQTKLLLDVGGALGGRYHLAFRGYHVLLLVILIVLFVRVARVETWSDVAALGFALTVLVGLHTFEGLVREAYPVNHYLLIAVLALALFALAQGRRRVASDVGAMVLFTAAVLTLESGLLLWIIAGAGYVAGYRGISRRGLAGITALASLYLVVRVGYLQMDATGIGERSTGFGIDMLSASDQIARFGDNPLPLYAYTSAMAATSLLLSQPSLGQWTLIAAWQQGGVPPVFLVDIGSSLAVTLLIGWYMMGRNAQGARRGRDPIVFVFVTLLIANAIMSYAYAKNEILSTSGVFYALAAYAATRALLASTPPRLLVPPLAIALLIVSTAWAVRVAGLQYALLHGAFDARSEWAGVLSPDGRDRWPKDDSTRALVSRLRDEAVNQRTFTPAFLPRWSEAWWGED